VDWSIVAAFAVEIIAMLDVTIAIVPRIFVTFMMQISYLLVLLRKSTPG
jgi:hypothetical protein